MGTRDWLQVGVLWLIVLLIFHPLFYSEYVYTDEASQLWHYRPGNNYQMFWGQGRWITELLFGWLFRSIDNIAQIKYIRLFSLGGWVVSIPIWYYIIKQVVLKEGLFKLLPFFACLYLICMPPFAVYVQWASCLELFLANTLGLVSGYTAYQYLFAARSRIMWLAASVICGVLALATYQTGFGCFLIPFVLRLTAEKNTGKLWWIGIGIYLFIYAIYFLLFKTAVYAGWMAADQRTALNIDPFGKLKFLFTRPLNGSFHFTLLFPERSKAHFILYVIVFGFFLLLNWLRMPHQSFSKRLIYLATVCAVFVLVYIPGLLVKENYASNRTLMALNMVVFVLTAQLMFHYVRSVRWQGNIVVIVSAVFCLNALHNFRSLFLNPITDEYQALRTALENSVVATTRSVHFIQPAEDFFVQQQGLTRSWDEFGVPSTFFNWVPEFFVKQIVLEQTGDRRKADKLIVRQWADKSLYAKEHPFTDSTVIVLDAPLLLQEQLNATKNLQR